jgi:probable DNA metabolism protein
MIIYNIKNNFTSFFTAVFYAYSKKNAFITANNNIQLNLNDIIINVEADTEKSDRVINTLKKYDKNIFDDLEILFRSCNEEKYQTAFEYIRLLVNEKQCIRGYLSNPNVIIFNEQIQKVRHEAHRFTGFIRFMENDAGIFYAHFTPDNDITELLIPHFTAKYKKMPFVIHDTSRNILGVYNGNFYKMIKSDKQLTVFISENESKFTQLWKLYYDTVNIAERKNIKLMKSFMPVRYWNNLPEKK